MATRNQISYLTINKDRISDPILVVGSKHYEYDKENIIDGLRKLGLSDITGIDICAGDGVDHVVDITESGSDFIKSHNEFYATIICMEVLTNVQNPFQAADNLISMLKKDGVVILSECIVRKISKMPLDLWRFTYDGTKELFKGLKFDDSKAMISLTREKSEKLLPMQYPFPQILTSRHPDESSTGYLLRRIHRRFFAGGVFKISRLMPETTIYSISTKKS